MVSLNPWIGTAVAIATVAIAHTRLRFRMQHELQSEALKAAADANDFRKSLLEHVAYVEDKNRDLATRMTEMDRTHRSEMAEMQGRLDEAHKRHLECEERLITLVRRDG